MKPLIFFSMIFFLINIGLGQVQKLNIKFDSITNYTKDKLKYRYDFSSKKSQDEFLLMERIYFVWNTDISNWTNNKKWTYSYDMLGNVIEEVQYILWNSIWTHSTTNYSYNLDSNGNCTEVIETDEEGNSTTVWGGIFDDNGYLIEEINYYVLWGQPSKEFYVYDLNYNLIENSIQELYDGNWVNVEKGTYSYDKNDNMTVKTYYGWENGNWVNVEKFIYSYDKNDNMTVRLIYGWENGNWVNGGKFTYSYDAYGNKIEEINQLWNMTIWVNSEKFTYNYDENGNITGELEYVWENGNWVINKGLIYTYDSEGNLTNQIWQRRAQDNLLNYDMITNTYDENGNITVKIAYNWVWGKWRNNYKEIYVWQNVTAFSEQPILIEQFHLSQNYPNPFNPSTKITFTLPKPEHVTFDVYNTLGQKVVTLLDKTMNAGSHDVQFDASALPSGIYFYRIQAGEFNKVRKMVLLK